MRQAAGDFQADLGSRKEGNQVLRINRFQGLANFDSKTVFMLRRGGGDDLLQNLTLHGEQMLIIFFVFVFLVICVVCVFVSLCISLHLQ